MNSFNPNINPKKAALVVGPLLLLFCWFTMWSADSRHHRANAPVPEPTPFITATPPVTSAPVVVVAPTSAPEPTPTPDPFDLFAHPTPEPVAPQASNRRTLRRSSVATAPSAPAPLEAPAPVDSQPSGDVSPSQSPSHLGFLDIKRQEAASKGLVWVNSKSNVYHRPGGRWYGLTDEGYYTTEQQAISEGNRASER